MTHDENRDQSHEQEWSVGRLAAATGVTVRTLHHYEDIGLVRPTSRNAGGHRRYDGVAIARLYRVCVLRKLGLPLARIAETLDRPEWGLTETLRAHAAQLDREIADHQRLRSRVASVIAATAPDDSGRPVESTDIASLVTDMTDLDSPVLGRITFLVYRDLEAVRSWLVDVCDLGPATTAQDAEGQVVHVELRAGDGAIWLHRESEDFGLRSPASLGASTAGVSVSVEDVDAHHARAVERGASVEYGPVDQPYGVREYATRDPEGGLWCFMHPLPATEEP